jgi:hypothetical protein
VRKALDALVYLPVDDIVAPRASKKEASRPGIVILPIGGIPVMYLILPNWPVIVLVLSLVRGNARQGWRVSECWLVRGI